jgi:hypothetical protein
MVSMVEGTLKISTMTLVFYFWVKNFLGAWVSKNDQSKNKMIKKMGQVIQEDTDFFDIYATKLDMHEDEDLTKEARRQKDKKSKRKELKRAAEADDKARGGGD